MERPNNILAGKSQVFFLKPIIRKYNPIRKKLNAKFASRAILERKKCQGEIAKRNDEARAHFFSLDNSRTTKYKKTALKEPKIIEGRRTENSFRPRSAMKGIKV